MTAEAGHTADARRESLRVGLFAEILTIAIDTLRANKLRSALTILGVVIGVTSIVAMTSLIRGFGDQMHSLIRQMGSDTIYLQKFGFSSWASGRSFLEVLKRPNLTEEDAKAISRLPSVALVGQQIGGGPGSSAQRMTYGNESTKPMVVIGSSALWRCRRVRECANVRGENAGHDEVGPPMKVAPTSSAPLRLRASHPPAASGRPAPGFESA